jgi:hypothetical protein
MFEWLTTDAERIAHSVPKTERHQALEHRLRELRERADEARDAISALEATKTGDKAHDRSIARQVKAIEKAAEPVQVERQQVRLALAPLRAEHGERVRRALLPVRRDMALDIISALEMLKTALGAAEKCDELARDAGANVPRIAPSYFIALAAAERHLAEQAYVAEVEDELGRTSETAGIPFEWSWLQQALVAAVGHGGIAPEEIAPSISDARISAALGAWSQPRTDDLSGVN